MKKNIPIQPILLVIILAIIGAVILVNSQFNLFQSGKLEDSSDILNILQERFPGSSIHDDILDPYTIVLVHNGESEQCKRAIRFVESITENSSEYRSAVYVLQGENYLQPLAELPDGSCWVNNELPAEWLVYPTIFLRDTVYVGYGPATRHDIKKQIKENL